MFQNNSPLRDPPGFQTLENVRRHQRQLKNLFKPLWLVVDWWGSVQCRGCLRLKEAGADNETTVVRACRHSASCLISNQSSERRRAAVMRRPTKRLTHKSQVSRALQHKPPGQVPTHTTTTERQDSMQKRSESRFLLTRATVFPAKRLRLPLPVSHSGGIPLVPLLWLSWLQAGIILVGKKFSQGRPVCSERSW